MLFGLIKCLAPMGQKLGDKGVLLIRFHGQGGQCERDGERNVITHGAGRQCAPIGGMGLVDPDGGFHEPTQFRIIWSVLELNPQSISHWSAGTSMTWEHR